MNFSAMKSGVGADQHRAGDAAGAEGEARQRKTFFVRLPRQRQADRADAAAGTGGRLRAEQDFGEERGDGCRVRSSAA